jgi:hypothetical protein
VTVDKHAILIRQLQGLLAGKVVRFGAGTVTYPGGSGVSGSATVTHGLPRTPGAVFTQSQVMTAHARPGSVGATSFLVALRTVDGSLPGAGSTAAFYWLAIG